MKFIETSLSGAYIVKIDLLEDSRGFFGRTFCKREFTKINHHGEFVQFNLSFTKTKGTIRGMHYQLPPCSEVKLIRCIKGKVWDVLVDLREGSPTFLKYFGIELGGDNFEMLYIPQGIAHGFQTLEDDSELIYHHSEFYNPEYERGVRYDEPKVGVKWPLPVSHISDKDRNYPNISESLQE